MEAMDVLQEQVANYENEVRMLNSMKSPKGKPQTRRQSVEAKSLGSIGKRQPSQTNIGVEVADLAAVGVLEAALFRPALSGALRDASKWKNAALSKALLELPPLSVPGAPVEEGKDGFQDDAMESLSRLTAAMNAYRMEQASAVVIDLEKCGRNPRAYLRGTIAKERIAAEELSAAAAAARRFLL
jgi:hypothetical protein